MKLKFCIVAASVLIAASADAQLPHDDYPALAIRMHHEGEARYHAEYDPDGHLTTCTITKSSGYPELDAQTCAVAKRLSHTDPQMTASKDGSMKWKMPKN